MPVTALMTSISSHLSGKRSRNGLLIPTPSLLFLLSCSSPYCSSSSSFSLSDTSATSSLNPLMCLQINLIGESRLVTRDGKGKEVGSSRCPPQRYNYGIYLGTKLNRTQGRKGGGNGGKRVDYFQVTEQESCAGCRLRGSLFVMNQTSRNYRNEPYHRCPNRSISH